MLLIADSGSTKTSWRYILPDQTIIQAETVGINPFFQTSEAIAQLLQEDLLPQLPTPIVDKLFFYGAGCSTPDNIKKMQEAFSQIFSNANIEISDDMLGAARSLCQHSEGIVAILGTGSNSCFFDGQQIVQTIGGLGILLGDEGSGAYMGKLLIQDWLNGEMPKDFAQKFVQRYQLQRHVVLENVYSKSYPNRYLATFSKFLFDCRKENYAATLIDKGLSDFFDRTIKHYSLDRQTVIHFTGSIAFYFSDFLLRITQRNHLVMGKVVENPVVGLTLYHLELSN